MLHADAAPTRPPSSGGSLPAPAEGSYLPARTVGLALYLLGAQGCESGGPARVFQRACVGGQLSPSRTRRCEYLRVVQKEQRK